MPFSYTTAVIISSVFGVNLVLLLALCVCSTKKKDKRSLSFYREKNKSYFSPSVSSGVYETVGPEVPQRPSSLPPIRKNEPQSKPEPPYVEPASTPVNSRRQTPGGHVTPGITNHSMQMTETKINITPLNGSTPNISDQDRNPRLSAILTSSTKNVSMIPTQETYDSRSYMELDNSAENNKNRLSFQEGDRTVNLRLAPTPTKEIQSFCRNPYNPEMEDRDTRLQTYIEANSQWPKYGVHQKILKFVDAGLYYLGERDCVKCWFCGGNLHNWEKDDDPQTEHAKWYPSCEYIKRLQNENTYEAPIQATERI